MTEEEKLIWAAAFALARQQWWEASPSERKRSRHESAARAAANAVMDFRLAVRERQGYNGGVVEGCLLHMGKS